MGEFKSIPMQAKLEVLYRIWSGERVTRVAHECGVSRQVIYAWKRRAEGALSRALKEKRRGPRTQDSPQNQETEQRQRRTEEFSHSLEKTQEGKENSYLSRAFNIPQPGDNGKTPERCPACGCEKVYKNGTYIKKNQDNGQGKHNELKRMQVVQRYICAWCKNSLS
ncbi:helix-turn-helix domain-containing protein [Candidatus Aerophobetes bacterium]|nr:helix-turn-helix domain-containing protein [Candidatus Aerophobetes bacterium]